MTCIARIWSVNDRSAGGPMISNSELKSFSAKSSTFLTISSAAFHPGLLNGI